jgi:type II secretory pathway component PulM
VRSRSERQWLEAIVAVVVLALLWLLVWRPLASDTDRLVQRQPLDKAALVEARRASDEIAGLARSAPAPQASDARAALDAVLAAKNLKNAATQIERIDNDRVRATFERIDFDTLAATLDAVQREGRLRAVEVVATARVEPGLVRADVTLTR